MIFLLGTCHSIQSEWNEPGTKLSAKLYRFRNYLANAALSNGVTGIAEEFNRDGESSQHKTIAQEIAESSKPPLKYIQCDPDLKERQGLGIPDDSEILRNIPPELIGKALDEYRDAELLRYFPAREKFWLERIRQIPSSSVLLVCGANHVPTFACRLTETGNPWHILIFNWWAADDREHGPLPFDERPI